MQDHIRKRAARVGRHILKTSDTVRQAAEHFGVSKSTIHKDVSERLPKIDAELYWKVSSVLYQNKKECHIRGGEATRRKYQKALA
jgi:putative DeoR family transcriptional regulator (stage III sporulation protein D)